MAQSVKEEKVDFLRGMKSIFEKRKELKRKEKEMTPEEKIEKEKEIILDILSYRVFINPWFETYTEKEKKVFTLIGELIKGMVDNQGKITTQELLDMLDYSTLQKTLQKKNDILDRIESLLLDDEKQSETTLEFKKEKVELGGRRRKKRYTKRYTKRYSKKSKVKKNKKRRTMRKK